MSKGITGLETSPSQLGWTYTGDGFLQNMVTGARKSQKKVGIIKQKELTAYVLWHMWKARNTWCFRGETWTERETIERACEEWMEFEHAQ